MSRSEYSSGKTNGRSSRPPSNGKARFDSKKSSSKGTGKTSLKSLKSSLEDNEVSEGASLTDLEKRLEQRLAVVDAAVTKKTSNVENIVEDEIEETPLTYEVTEALSVETIGLGAPQIELTEEKTVGDATPTSSEATGPNGIAAGHGADQPSLDWQNANGDADSPADGAAGNQADESTASLTLMSALDKYPENPKTIDSAGYDADGSAQAAIPDEFELPYSTIQPESHRSNQQADQGMMAGSDLIPDPIPASRHVTSIDLDNDPPPISPYLNRTERIPDGRRLLVVSGFLGGLSIAFIGVWAYFYTLPIDGQSVSTIDNRQVVSGSERHGKLTFKINDVAWTGNEASPLMMSIGGNQPERGILVKLEGLPGDARLSKGFPSGDGDWIIPSAQLSGLTLSLGTMPERAIRVRARLLEKDQSTDTGNFASFSVFPENRVPTESGLAPGFAVANTAMQPIPAPKPVDGRTGDIQDGSIAGPGSADRVFQGASNDYQPGLSQTGDLSGVDDSDDDEESFGVLPGDFADNSAATGVSAAVQRAARSALVTPPARARKPDSNQVANVSPELSAVAPRARPGPAGLPPRAATTSITNDHLELIRDGDRLMRAGDIRGARALYRQAMKGKSAKAAMALGRSYDPIYISRIKAANLPADAQRALGFYRQALAGGMETAQIKIDKLVRSLSGR